MWHMNSAEQFRKQSLGSVEYLPDINLPRCRICLEEKGELIQLPCSCIGEIGLIHQHCFAQWVSTLRNQINGLRSHSQSLYSLQGNFYQIPCEICKSNIKIEMIESRSCISCQEIKRFEVVLAIICILFSLGMGGIVAFLCISSIIKTPDNGLRIFINVFIMVVIYIILIWITKLQITKLYHRQVTSLKIVRSEPTAKNNNDVVKFDIEQQPNHKTQERDSQTSSQKNQGKKSSRRSTRRKRVQNHL